MPDSAALPGITCSDWRWSINCVGQRRSRSVSVVVYRSEKTLVYHKRPDQIFPMVSSIFSHDGHFGLGRGGVSRGGGGAPPMVVGRSNVSLAVGT